jgi:biofilm PGA synthesis N-glycosyltransferase PgaC
MPKADGRILAARAGGTGFLAAGWILAGYPLSLLLARSRPLTAGDGASPSGPAPPTVSVVVPAAGSPAALDAKLAALACDAAGATVAVQLVAALDGDEALRDVTLARWPGATVTFAPERRGKAQALRDALALATGEVVVLTDADNVLAPGSLRAALRHFADPAVWAVAGRRGEAGSLYDRYEDAVRRLESRSGSVAAASGEFLAVRASRLRPVPAGTVNDDLWILLDLLARGGRVVYEPAAGGTESPLPAADELERRARIAAGRVQLLRDVRRLPPRAAWRVVNHKVARLALPPLAVTALCGLPAAPGRAGRAAACAEAAVLGAGLAHVGGHRPRRPRARKVTGACGQLVIGLAATARGVARAAGGRQPAVWQAVR